MSNTSKICRKYVFLFSIGLLPLVPLVTGCNWDPTSPQKPVVVPDEPKVELVEQPVVEPPIVLPVVEPERVQPIVAPVVPPPPPEPVVVPEPVLEIKEPVPVQVPEHVVETPEGKEPVKESVVEEPAAEEPSAPVRTDVPVDQTSPVEQTSPVNTDSPVNTQSPVLGGGVMRSLLRLIPLAILVLQDEAAVNAEAQPVPEPVAVPPTPPQTPPDAQNTQPQAPSAPQAQPEQPAPPEQPEQPVQRQGRGERRGPLGTPGPPRAPVEMTPSKVVATPRTEEAKSIRFNFRSAPWKDVISWFADQAALSLQADKMPTGTFNLTASDFYTPTEALDILNSSLQYKDYSLVRKGQMLFVLYLPDGIPANLLEPITVDELDTRGKYEICRVIFNLNRTPAEIVQNEIERLLGPQGNILPIPRSQQIVITETAGTLRAIREIIKRIDDPESVEKGTVQTVELKNLTGEEALQLMRALLVVDAADTALRTAVDTTGKKIFLSGRGDLIERAKDILSQIDASDDPALVGQPQFETYEVGFADPATVLAVLQTLLAGTPDVRLSLDPKTNGILVRGRLSVQATVKEAIKQMQLNAPQVDIIPLRRMSPMTAVETIKQFYPTSSLNPPASSSGGFGGLGGMRPAAPSGGTQPPTVEPDTTARRIIVRGTLTQIKEIRDLLATLGEDGTATAPSSASAVRVLPLSPTASTLVLEHLQSILPSLDSNIKVNLPTMPAPPTPKPVPPIEKEKNLDELIDETFETEQPMTLWQHLAEQPILAQVAPATQPEVNVQVTPGGIVLSSDDPEALAKIEELIQMLSDESVLGRTELKVYKLTYASPSAVRTALNELMGTTVTGSVTGVGSMNLPEWQNPELAGLFAAHGNTIEKTGTVTITENERLFSLFIQANAVDHKTIEGLIEILDQPNRDDILSRAMPRQIKLYHMRAEEAKISVEQVFAAQMRSAQQAAGGQGGRGGQQPGGGGMSIGGFQIPPQFQAIASAFLGGGRGAGGGAPGGGGGAAAPREQEPQMTLYVHADTNTLTVSSTESTFQQVEAFVKELDAAAAEKVLETVVIQLEHAPPAFAKQSLENLLGAAVSIKMNEQTRPGGSFGGGTFGGPGGTAGLGGLGGIGATLGGPRPGGGGLGGVIGSLLGGGGGGGNPFMSLMGGMRPGGTFGGGTMGGGQRPGGTFGGGTFGGQRPGGTFGGARPAGQ